MTDPPATEPPPTELLDMDAYWRAADYLSVGPEIRGWACDAPASPAAAATAITASS